MSLWNFSNSILIDYSQFFWIIFNRNFVKWQSTWIRMGKTDVCKLVELVLKPVFPGSEHLQLLATLRQQIFLKNWGGFSYVGEHFVGFYQNYPLNWNTTWCVLGLTLWNMSMTWFKQNDINRWAVPVAFSSQFTRLHRRWNRLSEKKWNFPFPCHRFKYKRHIFAEPTNLRPCFH